MVKKLCGTWNKSNLRVKYEVANDTIEILECPVDDMTNMIDSITTLGERRVVDEAEPSSVKGVEKDKDKEVIEPSSTSEFKEEAEVEEQKGEQGNQISPLRDHSSFIISPKISSADPKKTLDASQKDKSKKIDEDELTKYFVNRFDLDEVDLTK
ncbi:hypothetical protein L2E82_22301 [Cichorium intybus]|uniref:Uncharacterized protein n=1 Tax=Cichorium intybus TaxID=13427 RepID=A0ACB9DX21_CICIN|nr:hypothetical protein L2E82_22301 [Cichorium intybus]